MARRMTVVGCGYLGATHAACMAELGFEVLGLDVDESRVEALQQARPPFYEPGLEPLLRKHVESMDVVQETLRKAAANLNELELRSQAAILQWLAKIAENQMLDVNRQYVQFDRDVRRRDPAETCDLVHRCRHSHFQNGDVETGIFGQL